MKRITHFQHNSLVLRPSNQEEQVELKPGLNLNQLNLNSFNVNGLNLNLEGVEEFLSCCLHFAPWSLDSAFWQSKRYLLNETNIYKLIAVDNVKSNKLIAWCRNVVLTKSHFTIARFVHDNSSANRTITSTFVLA